MPNNNRNTSGLIAHAALRSQQAYMRIDKAIRELMFEKASVNFNSVALRANVSKTTLYNNADFRRRIETLRDQQNALADPKHTKIIMSEKSKDVLLAAKNKRIAELEAEVAKLSNILKRCYANEYEKY